MKKSILIISIGIIFFTSCRKENSISTPPPVTTNESVLDYFPLKAGNYWVYKQSEIDSSGNNIITTYPNDSIVVKNDTLINNLTYHTVSEYNFLGMSYPRNQYLRDSGNFIVNEKGEIIFSINSGFIHTQLLSSDTIAYVNYSFINQTSNITVPLGVYSCVDFRGEIYRKMDNYNRAYLSHNYYNKGIGSVRKIERYIISLGQIDLQLISYHVQ
ncbi:MAG: hypothetical protein HXX18_04605 [Bacteroidetes bacterium]|nr:hypothetical protein [Bacteroidota bacterium]